MPGKAKVLYAAIETDTEELARLAEGARNAVSTSGAEVDGQRFRPHLTLARMNRPVEATKWVRLLDTYRGQPWQVEEIALVASHLGEGPRRRARHEVVETFSLGRADPRRPAEPPQPVSLGRAGSGPAPPDAPPRGR